MPKQELKGFLKGADHAGHSNYGHQVKEHRILLSVSLRWCHDQLYKIHVSNFIQQEHVTISSQPSLNLASLPSKLTQWSSRPYIHILNCMVPTSGIRAHDAVALDSVLLQVGLHYELHKKDIPKISSATGITSFDTNLSEASVQDGYILLQRWLGQLEWEGRDISYMKYWHDREPGMDCHLPCLTKIDAHTELTTL